MYRTVPYTYREPKVQIHETGLQRGGVRKLKEMGGWERTFIKIKKGI